VKLGSYPFVARPGRPLGLVLQLAKLAACHAQLGQMNEARVDAVEALRLHPSSTISWNMMSEPFKNLADAEPMVAGMRKAGLPE
jgi:hypothetical protein